MVPRPILPRPSELLGYRGIGLRTRCYASRVHREVLVAGQGGGSVALAERRVDPVGQEPEQRRPGWVARHRDLVGVVWVVAAGVALLVPELVHGQFFGPYDLLGRVGLTKQPGVPIQSLQYGDLIDSLLPWKTMVWQQVHQGHLPLWNPYSGLGIPLAFNWQSGPLSLSSIVGYLVPVQAAFTVGIVVDLLVAGTGAYFLGRVLRMGVVTSAAVGTVFELSGPIAAWLGFPFPSVLCWAGWIFAFGILVLRGRHRAGYLVALAVSVAFALYGGAPEGFVVLMLTVAIFFAFLLFCRARWMGGDGPILRPALSLVVAGVAGIALALPFALPSLQLSRESVRSLSSNGGALSVHTVLYLAFQSFDGLPIFRNGRIVTFGYSAFYAETAMYVGVSALVLAGVAIVVRRRTREVQGFALVTLVCLVLVFAGSVSSLAAHLPMLGQVNLVRSAMPMALAIAVLGGYGIDAVVRAGRAKDAARWLAAGFLVAGFLLGLLWLFGRGDLDPVQTSIRSHSFIWPAVETIVGLATAAFLFWADRQWHRSAPVLAGSLARRRHHAVLERPGLLAGVALLTVQAAFLVSAGAQMVESSPTSFPQTPATVSLESQVGAAEVGFGSPVCTLGLVPNINGVYRVHELSIYDPIIPKRYFTSWSTATGTKGGYPGINTFCPAVTSAAEARMFGVGYVLQRAGSPGPTGGEFVRRLGDEDLYRIPGSGEATVAPLEAGSLPADRTVGTPVPVHHPNPSEWQLTTSSHTPQAVRFHVSNVPGWSATIDGRSLQLEPYAGMMLQARVPAGTHTIVLRYWPKTFTVGIVLAVASAVFLVGLLVLSGWRRRHPGGTANGGQRPR